MRCLLMLLALLLAACAAKPVPQPVFVPVPVACRETVPTRPAMPTESLRQGVDLDVFVRAALAEIERRQGYEDKLLTALEACRQPMADDP